MRSLVRRRLLVTGLILAAGAATIALGVRDQAAPGLPAVRALTAGSAWRAAAATPPVAMAMRYQQWVLADAAGNQALLYVGATARARTMLEWSGELGYQGAGYLVEARHTTTLRLPGGPAVTVGQSTVRHLDDRRLLAYAVVGPTGVGARGSDLLLPAAWDLVLGRSPTYYAVRVSVPAGEDAAARAASALAPVLAHLLAIDRGS